MNPFLRSTMIVNWDHPEVLALASYLTKQGDDPQALVTRTFNWVRDRIEYTWEYQKAALTLRASDVLVHKRGCCFAKSHLLAALLRANGISAGFAYRVVKNERGAFYRLHGLNTVYLPNSGWCDFDAMGDQYGVMVPAEGAEVSASYSDGTRIKGIWPNPLSCAVGTLPDYYVKQECYYLPEQECYYHLPGKEACG